ncbi:hypothetical protein D3C71_1863780 [compost metagenome]
MSLKMAISFCRDSWHSFSATVRIIIPSSGGLICMPICFSRARSGSDSILRETAT